MPLGDFTDQANSYAQSRPGYPALFLHELYGLADCRPGDPVVDLGAGTGILTKSLVDAGFQVTAVEPNAAMRTWGQGIPARWVDGTFECTQLESQSQKWAVAAQSFHWAEPQTALPEIHRILRPQGHFTILWNEKDPIPCPLLAWTYARLKDLVPEFSEGYLHQNWPEVLSSTGHFAKVRQSSFSHQILMSSQRYLSLWKSHNRLAAIAGEPTRNRFLAELESQLARDPSTVHAISYRCIAWTAQKRS